MNSRLTGEPSVIYGNVRNAGLITSLPEGCAVEVPCLVDASGLQPTYIGDLPPQLFLTVALQLAETLARLHERNILHRDVSPTNVVIGPCERVTLVDFGAATPLVGPRGVPARVAGAL